MGFRELIKIIWWSFKLNMKISPFNHLGLLISNIASVNLPIVQNYFYALTLQEIVNIVATGKKEFTQTLILLLILSCILTFLRSIPSILDSYCYLRLRHAHDKMLRVYYLQKLSTLNMYYHDDSKFKTKSQKAEEAVNWRFGGLSQDTYHFIANFIGLISLIGILFTLNVVFIVIIIIPIIFDFLINKKYGKDIYGIWDYKGDERKHADNAGWSLRNIDIIRESKIYNFAPYLIKRYKDAHDVFINSIGEKLKRNIFSLLLFKFWIL